MLTTKVLTFKARSFVLSDGKSEKKIKPEVAEEFSGLADKKAERVLRRLLKFFEPPSLPPFPYELDPHQIEGINWVMTRSRSYLGHCPGAGKTLEALVCAEFFLRKRKQVLFVIPPQLVENWLEEIAKFKNGSWSVAVVPRTENKDTMRWGSDIVICPDSRLGFDWVQEAILSEDRQWRFLAVDEASRFKEPFSNRSLALFGGQKENDKKKVITFKGITDLFKIVVLMDGTPMPNRPIELWAPTYALAPEVIDFRNYNDFGYRYCGPTINERGIWEFNHSSYEEELREKLQSKFMHVVTEEQLKHPERLRSVIYISDDPRTTKQKKWDEELLKELQAKMRLGGPIGEDLSFGVMATRRRELGEQKIPWSLKFLRAREEKNENIILFGWHREVCGELCEELQKTTKKAWGLVIGGTPKDEREEYFREFRKGKLNLVGNISALGVGYNLQEGDLIYFHEPSWSEALNRQAEKRAARRGRDSFDFVRSLYPVIRGTLEEQIISSNLRKEQRTKRIIG